MTENTDLHAVAFFLADHAAVESGKIYTQGGFWNRIGFPSFPAVYTFSVVAILHVPWRAYHQNHKFGIWFEDADGVRMPGDFEGEFKVGSAPDMKVGEETIVPVAAMLGNFSFPRAADYSAVLQVDGTEISRWTFHVIQVFAPQGIARQVGPADIPPIP